MAPHNRFSALSIDWENGFIDLSHGSGGRSMAQLIDALFITEFDNTYLRQGNDQSVVPNQQGRMVMTTDSYVISPLFFPGGDIGSLAVHGTVNDICMSGAIPAALSAGFILEEGLPLSDLRRVVQSMAKASREAGVPIITGDTKVVERGKADGIFINTAGVGYVPEGLNIGVQNIRPGDAILVSGSMGDHGIAVLSQRESLGFVTTLKSDSAALHTLVAAMVEAAPDISCLRDPTRGGLGTTLNELSVQANVGMEIVEDTIPLLGEVKAACDLLGLDPLYAANEGKLVAFCPEAQADKLLKVMQQHPLGQKAAKIGNVVEDQDNMVILETSFGGRRILDWPTGIQLPRIC